MTQLQDTDLMPWGKYKCIFMQNVPADYLFYLWTELDFEHKVKENPVADYINRNLATLEIDYPDGIWRK